MYCRQHINKMFHFPLSSLAVCMKTAPVLLHSCSTLSFHLRLPRFSLLLLTCFHLRGATKRKRKPRFIPEEHQRWEKRIKWESALIFLAFFSFLFFSFLCFVHTASHESRTAGVSFRVDTGTQGTLSSLPGKTCKEVFLSDWPYGKKKKKSFLFWCLCFYFENMYMVV